MNPIPSLSNAPQSIQFGMSITEKLNSTSGEVRAQLIQEAFANGYEEIGIKHTENGELQEARAARATADAIRKGELQTPQEACEFYDQAMKKKVLHFA